MPRYPRKNLKTSFFHVITQGIEKKYIFNNAIDIKYYIKLIYKIKNEYNIKILAYCIMNNHAHILLKTDTINNLSKYMQRVNMLYGNYYNKKYNRVGYVFRDRFKSEGIFSESHLYNCINYIFNNPVKAGICNNPSEYPYSNYRKIKIIASSEYEFIDVSEDKNKIIKDCVNEYLQQHNLGLIDLENNKKKMEEIILILKDKYHLSLRKISSELKTNREKVRKIYNNSVNENRPH